MARHKKYKLSNEMKFILLALIIIFFWKYIPIGSFSGDVYDTSHCDPDYANVCFYTNVDPNIPSPLNLVDLSYTSAGTGEVGDFNSHSAGWVHYPGSPYQLERDGLRNYRAGPGRYMYAGFGSITDSLGRFDMGGVEMYQWRPDRVALAGPTHSGSGAYGYGHRYSEVEWYQGGPLGNIFLVHGFFRSTSGNSSVQFRHTIAGQTPIVVGDTFENNIVLSGRGGSVNEHITVTFSVAPDMMGVEGNDALAGFQVGSDGEWREVWVVVKIRDEGPSPAEVLADPEAFISDTQDAWSDWFGMYDSPPMGVTGWARERYYRSLYNYGFNYLCPTTPDTLWTQCLFTPGSGYAGVWIWDSAKAAIGAVPACSDADCMDIHMNGLRVLIDNKYADGQWPREVWQGSKGVGWQAPGLWPFAVDQADRRFGGTQWSAEFYDELKGYHEWVMLHDSDGDYRFEWGGTNSGWDGSIRWDPSGAEEALDLQSFMILGAESLKSMAERIGRTEDVTMWDARILAYKEAAQLMCTSDNCYDLNRDSDQSTGVLSIAQYNLWMAGAVTGAQAQEMTGAYYDANELAPNPGAAVPTTARSNSEYYPVDDSPAFQTWSGAHWADQQLFMWLGCLRYSLGSICDDIRSTGMEVLQIGGIGYESYNGETGMHFSGGFSGDRYVWSDSAYMVYVQGSPFVFQDNYDGEVPPQCIPSTEVCDGLDNDCDELIDEDLVRTCDINGNPGSQGCVAGEWLSCDVTSINTYSCVDNACVLDVNGIYSDTATCEVTCQAPVNDTNETDSVLCDSSGGTWAQDSCSCPSDSIGWLDDFGCDYLATCGNCGDTYAYYGCNADGMCVQDDNGQYITSNCNDACTAPPPPPQVIGNNLWVLLAVGAVIYFVMNKKKGRRKRSNK